MKKIFIIPLLCFIISTAGCKDEDPVFGERQFFFGTWAVNRSTESTREDGVVVFQIEENGTRFIFNENGSLIWDRGFYIDTMTWFYVPDPETMIFGDYRGSSQFGAPGIFAHTLAIQEKTDERFVMYGEHVIQDTIGRDIVVKETWEILD